MTTEHGYVLWDRALEVINGGGTIHAAAGPPPTNALCGLSADGPLSLDLTHPEAGEWRHTVNCQDCLEWMHA